MYTLKEKLQNIINKNGFKTSYMSNMMYAIEQFENNDPDYKIYGNSVVKTYGYSFETLVWNLEYCIGEYVLLNNIEI